MVDCEKNIFDIPVSPTAPALTDYIMFTLVDGTTVLRTVANSIPQIVPDDIEITVADSGGQINNGDSQFIYPAHIGQRVRVFRNYTPASRDITKDQYYSFDASTGTYNFTPAASSGEVFQFQAY